MAFKLYVRKINLGKYRYEVYGGTHGGQHHSAMFETRSEAMKHKKSLTEYARKHPSHIQFRKHKKYRSGD